jgi:hypothetical protein
MTITPLPLKIESKGFVYEQVERHQDLAIYRQTRRGHTFERFEVILIQVRPEVTWPDGTVVEAHEYYPGSHSWGRLAWTCHDLPRARALLANLQTKRAAQVAGRRAVHAGVDE